MAGARAGVVEGKALATAQHAIAPRHLTRINAATLDAGAGAHHQRQRLGHQHRRVPGMHRHRLAELRGEAAGPGAGAVQQPRRVQLQTGLRAYAEALTVMFNGVHRALFMHLRTVTLRRPGECRGHQPWVGVAVIRAIRRAHRHLADPWKTRTQLSAVEHLQIEAETLAAVGIVLQGAQIVEAAGEFQVAAALIFTVDADQLWQLRPDRMRSLRQWQL
ncbi:hypothetical protein D3C87_1129260 [compost metagenome]